MSSTGRAYKYDQKAIKAIYKFIDYGYSNFKNPILFHIKAVVMPNNLKLETLLKNLNRNLDKIYKDNARDRGSKVINGMPDVKWFWSLEYGNGSVLKSHYHPKQDKRFIRIPKSSDSNYHLHLYAMVDCNLKKYRESPTVENVRKAVNQVDGLDCAIYLKRENGELFHRVKNEIDDAKERMVYLAKIEQKQDEKILLTFRKKRGGSLLNDKKG